MKNRIRGHVGGVKIITVEGDKLRGGNFDLSEEMGNPTHFITDMG